MESIIAYATLALKFLPLAISGVQEAIDGYNAAQAKIQNWITTKTNPTPEEQAALTASIEAVITAIDTD